MLEVLGSPKGQSPLVVVTPTAGRHLQDFGLQVPVDETETVGLHQAFVSPSVRLVDEVSHPIYPVSFDLFAQLHQLHDACL